MYRSDSFFSLSPLGSIGLAALSAVLALGLLAGLWRAARGRGMILRLGLVGVMFVSFVWLSPQIYYAYYMVIFDDLPVQWVGRFPDVQTLWQTVSFTGRATLSAHSQGVLFWLMVILASVPRGQRR
jgi:hypothetical protein